MILQEIHVGLSNELIPRDLQAANQILGDGNSLLFSLIGAKDDFQLHEIAAGHRGGACALLGQRSDGRVRAAVFSRAQPCVLPQATRRSSITTVNPARPPRSFRMASSHLPTVNYTFVHINQIPLPRIRFAVMLWH